MINIWLFLGIQFGLLILGIGFWLVRSLIIKNKKLNDIVTKQNKYLLEMYETITYTGTRIKQIDKAGIFQGDDEVGFFFTAMKELSEQLEEYIKFVK